MPIAFAMIGRDGRVLRAGQLPLTQLGAIAGAWPVHVILDRDDAVVARVTVPPVSSKRLEAAVIGSIEPMVLSDLDTLVVAHGPRAADGNLTAAWASRSALRDAWALLAGAGLAVAAFVPLSLALPAADPNPGAPLALPADARWLAPLPKWSLAQDTLNPGVGLGRWRAPMRWALAAGVIWVLGLNSYAMQLNDRVRTLQQSMQQAVKQAFPRIPVIIDPLRQAQQQRDALRLAQGESGTDDFMPLALAAARVLDFAQGHVQGMQYEPGHLSIRLADGYTPPANEAALMQAAAVQDLQLARDPDQPQVWHVRRPGVVEPSTTRAERP